MKPRVLIVGRTRYDLPLAPWLERKWRAVSELVELRIVAAAGTVREPDARFELLPPVRPRALDGLAFYALLPWRGARAIRRFGPDVVVAENPHIGAMLLLARRLSGLRPKLVVEVHGDWRIATRLYGSPARRVLNPVADAVARAGLRGADATRALSGFTAWLAERGTGRAPAAVFPTYSELTTFDARPPEPLPETPTALFVGVLELYKGVDTLAQAWPRVAREVPGARLVVVGRGPRRNVLEGLGELIEELAPEEVARRMDESWVLVLPSRFEGLGRVVIESFARGRGVVAGRAGGILDLVRDGEEGLLVDPENAGELVAALTRVLSDRALAERLGARAHEAYAAWRTTPDAYAQSLRRLVDEVGS